MLVKVKLGCKPIGIEENEIVYATRNKMFDNLVDLHKNNKVVPEMNIFIEVVNTTWQLEFRW